jgi:hypothetical protein
MCRKPLLGLHSGNSRIEQKPDAARFDENTVSIAA